PILPFGTGIWTPGVQNNVVKKNEVRNHQRYGILITQSWAGEFLPINNRVRRNFIRNSGIYDLAWDGIGVTTCFADHDPDASTAPPLLAQLYPCDRPTVGVPYPLVNAALLLAAYA
ncbi:MAG: hypothetical protein KY469_12630, partial [Actinobacteria bacterium]|nr:hypothetical protein [Actinomycetota bacterium]